MAYRLPAHLHRNRHGVLYFRLTVPNDIRHLLESVDIRRQQMPNKFSQEIFVYNQ
jgi:hypothetical protein